MNAVILPLSHARRLADVRRALEIERRSPSEFRGKRLQSARELVSVPLGRRWRAIFLETVNGYKFRDCLSHERYNKANFNHYRA
jgi:hypothetical protein